MLSLSIDESGETTNFDGLLDPLCKELPSIPDSAALIQLVDAFMAQDSTVLGEAREQVVALMGAPAMVDAIGVAANFQRMVRIADSTAIPPVNMGRDELADELNEKLGLNDFSSAANARAPG